MLPIFNLGLFDPHIPPLDIHVALRQAFGGFLAGPESAVPAPPLRLTAGI